MCGIVGYVGEKQALPVLIKGLRRLEYRGYDSAGICELNGKLTVHKTKGRIDELENLLSGAKVHGTVGIGHTRWATHGAPSNLNAHPHYDCLGKIAVVHNGIIENYLQLKAKLEKKGHHFTSETDTEVISHLVEDNYDGDILKAVHQSMLELKGSFALVVISEDHPGQLIVVRQDSPLIIGLGKGENYVASDIPAILEYTKSVYILDDGEIARVTPGNVELFDRHTQPIHKDIFEVKWDAIQAEKEGYADFMLKEIHEQPQAVKATLAGRIDQWGKVNLEAELPSSIYNNVNKIQLLACGTAYHACLYGKHLLDEFLDLNVEADLASEYRYKRIKADEQTLTIVVSQSGETADTIGAMRLAKSKGAKVLAITNVVGSTVSREADAVIYTHAGPEIAVASTKAYTTQLACLLMLAGYLRDRLTGIVDKKLYEALGQIPDHIETILAAHEYRLEDYGSRMVNASDAFFLGRGLDYASAMEGQLKLKEISYIHGEALAGGELKHGTLALIEEDVPVIALLTQIHLADKMISNLREVKARGGEMLLLAMTRTGDYGDLGEVMLLPKTDPLLAPLLTVVPMQVLAYYTAKARGCDVDKPRNLAKSVTVE